MSQIKSISNQSSRKITIPERFAFTLNRNVEIFDLVDIAIEFHQNGMLDAASLIYEEILTKDPGHVDAMNLLGLIALQKKEYPQAISLINRAILASDQASIPEFHANLGSALHQERLLDESIASYDIAISMAPNIATFYKKRGLVQLEKKYFNAAIDSFNNAIKLQDQEPMAYFYRGLGQLELKYLDAAICSFDQAVKLKTNFPEAFNNRGLAQLEKKYFDAAIESFDQAINLKPDYFLAAWNKGLALLKLGNFKEGWPLYESRLKGSPHLPSVRPELKNNFIDIDQLAQKSILIFSEQGIGDTIQFYRYVKKIYNLNAQVTVAVQESLIELLSHTKPLWNIINIDSALPSCDFNCPLLSLPFVLQENHVDTLIDAPYIFSDSDKVAKWKSRLGVKIKPRIGLVWSGNTLFKNNAQRSIPLLQLTSFLPREFQYVSLQKELSDFDLKVLEKKTYIENYASDLVDFSETAALIDCMDLVITVDTSVAHLAGAMGKRTWLLLSDNADWRWFLNTDSSPWYPSIRLFRQEKSGEWSKVLKDIEQLLRDPFSKL